MASGDSTQRKRNNYKILVDPELKKGHKKVYRLNGKDVAGVWRALIRIITKLSVSNFCLPALAWSLLHSVLISSSTKFPPAGEPKDPRTQKTVLGVTGSNVDLKVPRFKVSVLLQAFQQLEKLTETLQSCVKSLLVVTN